jgi:hypothetical protein
MSGDDQESRNKKTAEEYNLRIKSGEPIMTLVAHEILRVTVMPTGEAMVDFVFAQTMVLQASVARIVLPKAAAQSLKAALVTNENIPDTPPPARDPRSAH